MTNNRKTVLYIGMTNSIQRRVSEHKNKLHSRSFTAKHSVCRLVYFEEYNSPMDAILREKQIKNYSRKNKEKLINEDNPDWNDLYY